MDPVSFGFGAFAVVIQLYDSSVKAYDLYLAVKDFPPTYLTLRLSLEIEQQRLKLWARQTIHNQPDRKINQSHQEEVLWSLFKDILTNMVTAFEGGTRSMEEYGQYAGFPKTPTSAGGYNGGIATSAHETSSSDQS